MNQLFDWQPVIERTSQNIINNTVIFEEDYLRSGIAIYMGGADQGVVHFEGKKVLHLADKQSSNNGFETRCKKTLKSTFAEVLVGSDAANGQDYKRCSVCEKSLTDMRCFQNLIKIK